ncbi:MAG: TadE/TadG family type IV pilus assembly protein, partial [Pseudomonadota bacterium]
RKFKNAVQNDEGVSALEFALIAPVLSLLYLGGVELSLLMQADRRITTATATMGDIASRATSISDTDMSEIFGSTTLLLGSRIDPTTARLRVSSLEANANGDVLVGWSSAQNFSPRAIGSSVPELPNNVVPDGGSVIMAELEYDYSSEVGYLDIADRTIRESFYLRPRRVDVISRTTSED